MDAKQIKKLNHYLFCINNMNNKNLMSRLDFEVDKHDGQACKVRNIILS